MWTSANHSEIEKELENAPQTQTRKIRFCVHRNPYACYEHGYVFLDDAYARRRGTEYQAKTAGENPHDNRAGTADHQRGFVFLMQTSNIYWSTRPMK